MFPTLDELLDLAHKGSAKAYRGMEGTLRRAMALLSRVYLQFLTQVGPASVLVRPVSKLHKECTSLGVGDGFFENIVPAYVFLFSEPESCFGARQSVLLRTGTQSLFCHQSSMVAECRRKRDSHHLNFCLPIPASALPAGVQPRFREPVGGGAEPRGGLPEEQCTAIGRHLHGGKHPGAAQKHAAGEPFAGHHRFLQVLG